ncbi:MAG: adenylosuccinate synthase [Bacteroidia bacterium]|nr:adenylosuccinate synthase [Bacteroidia bacterium]MCF8425948.1 adenylosuccinate synthase [Bacteroidia bacterium]MCF8446289.1 adenylosuccinate synthase [Bacteroidia bacterium]
MKVDVVLGLQWGDEGKGKIVDVLTPKYDVVARFQGGPNAGHSLEFGGNKYVLNTIPSGIFHEHCINIIGNGVVIDPVQLRKEIEKAETTGVDIRKNLYISEKAHVILPTHRLVDAASEAHKGVHKVGSTLRGISPTYQDKIGRSGLRIGDLMGNQFKAKYDSVVSNHVKLLNSLNFEYNLADHEPAFFEAVEYLKSFKIINSEYYINQLIKDGKKVLAEGAQGTLLDIDFGSYPFVTSSNTITGGACSGLGISPQKIDKVYGIFKAYCTRVGNGPFPTEQENETGELLRKLGHEFGATTGRPRRTGWLDLPTLKYAIMLNGVTDLICTKSDVLSGFDQVQLCDSYSINGKVTSELPFNLYDESVQPNYKSFPGWSGDLTKVREYNNLPETFRNYMDYVESQIEVPVSIISVGPDREETIVK